MKDNTKQVRNIHEARSIQLHVTYVENRFDNVHKRYFVGKLRLTQQQDPQGLILTLRIWETVTSGQRRQTIHLAADTSNIYIETRRARTYVVHLRVQSIGLPDPMQVASTHRPRSVNQLVLFSD